MIKLSFPGLLLLLFCPAARAEIASYPVGLQVTVTPGRMFRHPGPDAGLAPNPPCTVDASVQAREAYQDLGRRLFTGARGQLALRVEVTRAEISLGIDGWRANARHDLILASREGEAIDHFNFDIDAAITDSGPTAIPEAFDRAASEGVHRLERALGSSQALARWLQKRNLAPAIAYEPVVPRSAWAGYLDGGVAATSGGDDMGGAATIRAGATYSFFFLQLAGSAFTTSFAANPVFGATDRQAEQSTLDAGAEGGVSARLPHFIELRLGAGAHRLWGRAKFRYYDAQNRFDRQPLSVSFRFALTAPTAFAALQYNGWRVLKTRLRIGIEARGFFDSSITYSELQRTVPAADYAIGGFIGIELPSTGDLR